MGRGTLGAVLAALLGACQTTPAAPPRAERSPTERARQHAFQVPPPPAAPASEADWCVSGGAALVGAPVVDADDRLYFASADGTLHAFEADGRYRFSFTLRGTPLGSVSLRPADGSILLGTTERLVYAVSQNGVLRWSFSALTPVWSGIVPLDATSVVFLGLDRFLYALTTTGAARYRVRIPGEPVGEPLVTADGAVWIPLQDGAARVVGARAAQKIALSGAVETLVAQARGVAARSGRSVVLLRADGSIQERLEADEIGGSAAGLALVQNTGALEWRSARGTQRTTAKLGARLSASPLVTTDLVALPLQNGDLGLLNAAGTLELRKLGGAALGRPVAGRTRLFVPMADGQICALTPTPKVAWPRPE